MKKDWVYWPKSLKRLVILLSAKAFYRLIAIFTSQVYNNEVWVITKIELSRFAEKQISKLPPQIITKLQLWMRTVQYIGLEETRKIKGYHDEALSGKRSGQRSVRLNKAYRAIYVIKENHLIEFILIEEVNKHDY